MRERMQSCDTDHMFEKMSEHLEKTNNEKMPVRKFFNNTFGQMLNGAIFELQKKMSKANDQERAELQHHQGRVKFVALYMMSRLPEGEMTPEEEQADD